jgi:UDP-N-acetylglucosamine--N-acetylmuramyl-(pentapeptide) pyrophosphoryl-undecaprenol N-acetylglucosamine transferase
LRALIAGGGTGGHYFPALAVARELLNRGWELFFVGSERGIEKRLGFPAKEVLLLGHSSFRGKGISSLLSLPGYASALVRSILFLRKVKPNVTITFGGYSSLPVAVASRLAGVPLFIQEQNSVPGKVNRIASRFAVKCFLGFPRGEEYLSCKCLFTGNPLRREVEELSRLSERERKRLKERLGLDGRLKTLLVVGGSQGALFLNRLMERVAPYLPEGVQVIHLCGVGKCSDTRKIYSKFGVKNLTIPFYEKIWELYAVADAAVSRAGALAVSELSAFRVPTLFVPYPYAADQHQYFNALYLAERGGALLFRQEELTLELFIQSLKRLLFDIMLRDRMKIVMEESFPEGATAKIADEIERWTGKRG